MLVSSPEQFKDLFNVTVKTSHEVTEIDRKEQTVTVKKSQRQHNVGLVDVSSGRFKQPYDNLILATGSNPIVPPIEGVNAPGVFQLRDIPDSRQVGVSARRSFR